MRERARVRGSSRRVWGQTPDLSLAAVSLTVLAAAVLAFAAGSASAARGSAFDEQRAFALLKEQVALGPTSSVSGRLRSCSTIVA